MASTDEFNRLLRLEGVPSALAAARDAADAILRDRGRRATTPPMTAESLLRGAAASASLEGSVSSLDELRQGSGDAIAAAAARVNAEVLALVPDVQRTPARVFARLHVLAAAGRVESDALGRPRPDQGAVDSLRELGGWLVATHEAPAIAVAALAHAEIATSAPFEQGNGMVARAVERLIIVARGLDPASVLTPEAGHAIDPTEYRSALGRYAAGDWDGRRAWLLYAVGAFTAGLAASPAATG